MLFLIFKFTYFAVSDPLFTFIKMLPSIMLDEFSSALRDWARDFNKGAVLFIMISEAEESHWGFVMFTLGEETTSESYLIRCRVLWFRFKGVALIYF